MNQPLDFYFDYSSPYGYLASERIEHLATKHKLDVVWHPILLGVIFKITEQAPLTEAPIKGAYSLMDFSRSAREHNIAYRHPDEFPIGTVAAARASIWFRDHEDAAVQAQLGNFVHAVYRGYYSEGKDIRDVEVLAAIADSLSADGSALKAGLQSDSIKTLLRKEVNDAIQSGVFGSPMMIVDGEAFWGHDRLEQLDRWLETGGW